MEAVELPGTFFGSSFSETCIAVDIVGLKYGKRIEELSLEIYERVCFINILTIVPMAVT